MAKKSENIIDIVKTINNYKKMITDQQQELQNYQKQIDNKEIEITKLTHENNQLKATIKEFSNNLGPYLNTEENRKYAEKGKSITKMEEAQKIGMGFAIYLLGAISFMGSIGLIGLLIKTI